MPAVDACRLFCLLRFSCSCFSHYLLLFSLFDASFMPSLFNIFAVSLIICLLPRLILPLLLYGAMSCHDLRMLDAADAACQLLPLVAFAATL